jgi:GPI mannosyltransferase 3
VFTPLTFLALNLSGVSLFYGGNAWHYYLTQALPILTTTALPFVVHGIYAAIYKSSKREIPQRTMAKSIGWTLMVYSLAGHKEWRFIHPLLPLMHLFATKSIVDLSFKHTAPKAEKSSETSKLTFASVPWAFRALILLNLPVAFYTTVFYNSAPISVMTYLRNIPSEHQIGGSVGFLTPCHSTPGHAYLHRERLAHGAWSLGCEPPLVA